MMGIDELLVTDEDGTMRLEPKNFRGQNSSALEGSSRRISSIDEVSDDEDKRVSMLSEMQKLK